VKLSWIFGHTLAQRHLLYAYVSVWIIQGGYCAWVAWNWIRSSDKSSSGK
jgi:hypothetical protein